MYRRMCVSERGVQPGCVGESDVSVETRGISECTEISTMASHSLHTWASIEEGTELYVQLVVSHTRAASRSVSALLDMMALKCDEPLRIGIKV